ncbi:MAG: sulfite exporter TauE/SafE family protein [Mariprofundus sp.]
MLSGFESELLLYGLLIGVCAGALAGTLAGLAGVGGGLIYVPLFYAFLPAQKSGMALYVFASMVAIVITGFFSARAHWRLGHIDRVMLGKLMPGLIIGAGLGLWSTLHLPAAVVLLALAALDGWVAYDYGHKLETIPQQRPSLTLFSGPVGYASGALGIGGGTMIVPLLRRHLPLRFAVGTSAACTLLMAVSAVLVNLASEQSWLPLLQTEWPRLVGVWLGVALILPCCSQWSAHLHTRMEAETLRLVLKSTFVLLACGLLTAAVLSLIQTSS